MTAQAAPAGRHGFVRIDGRRLEYRWVGQQASDGPTLVWLHEGLGCVAMWRDFPDRVAAATGCNALLYSRAGYGRSGPAELPRSVDYMHREGLVVLPRMLEEMTIDRAILVGHSDGESIAIIHAGSGSALRVQGLILLAPHVFNEPLCVQSIRAAAASYRTTELRNRLACYHGEQVDHSFWGWNDIWLRPDFLDWNIKEYLPGISAPVLLLQGTQDQYGALRQLDAIGSRLSVPARRVLLPDCRHSPHRDQPQATLKAIVSFIREAK